MKELNSFISEAQSLLEGKLICAVLIGSRSRLDFNVGSDIDLILIGNWVNDKLFDRIDELKEKMEIPFLPIDFFLYQPHEIHILIDQGNPMILDGFTEGICLFNENYFREIKNKINSYMKTGLIDKKGKLWKISK
ncbi:MAG: nucleotidyltransferase domain-containing protein [Candidatus Lokiarchaeota archaeon]|nr:nucleotidyltransferase domain-containing protein [Candidatus Lokiarchaeota archaeon]